jgi:hypothetical protein
MQKRHFKRCFYEINLRHATRKRGILYHTMNCAKLEMKLFFLYENASPARAELVCNPYYLGVIDPCELNHIRDQTISGISKWDMFVLYEVDLNGSGQFDARIYSPCGVGVNIKLMYDEDIRKWAFYTDVNALGMDNDYMLTNYITGSGVYSTLSRGPLKYKHIYKFLQYEDKKYNNVMFNSLQDLINCVSSTYLCESCYQLLDYPRNTGAICIRNPLSKYKNKKVWTLQRLCSFFVNNMFHHKRQLIRTILPSDVYSNMLLDGTYEGREYAYKHCTPLRYC